MQITKESSADSIQAISEDSSEVDYAEINDSLPNTGKTISIDLRKMAHHSLDYSNPTFFLTSLNPKTVVLTSPLSWFNTRERSCLLNSSVFAATSDSASVVSFFTSSGIQSLNNTLYLFNEQGAVYSDGWCLTSSGYIYATASGALYTGLHEIDGKYYYFYNTWIGNYHVNVSGVWQ